MKTKKKVKRVAKPSRRAREEEEEGEPVLDIRELTEAMGGDFAKDVWGKKVGFVQADDAFVAALLDGFGGGEVANVLPECRKDDNQKYGPEEMGEIENLYEEQKKTINMPLCDVEGATALRNSFLANYPHLGNDVEVGVYYSRTGGETAPWHSDNNHNITIQLLGEKTWSCSPGSPHTVRSKAFTDKPKNAAEQLEKTPLSTPIVTYTLTPGSAIYLPPGHWHAVASTGREDSFSVDLRVGNVLHAKWLCEAVFSELQSVFHKVTDGAAGMGEGDFCKGWSAGMARQVEYTAANLEKIIRSHPIPKALPSERHLSNGIHRAATVSFLHNFSSTRMAAITAAKVSLTPHVAASHRVTPDHILFDLFYESTLSTMEYLRYTIHFPRTQDISDFIHRLCRHEEVDVTNGTKEAAAVLLDANYCIERDGGCGPKAKKARTA